MQMFWNLVLPDIVREDIVNVWMGGSQIKNLRIKMIFVTVADKYKQVFLPDPGPAGCLSRNRKAAVPGLSPEDSRCALCM